LDVLDRSHDETSELAAKVFELSQTLKEQQLPALETAESATVPGDLHRHGAPLEVKEPASDARSSDAPAGDNSAESRAMQGAHLPEWLQRERRHHGV
jgi:hypothetical protein